jgi:hypothetical protein
MMHTIQISPNQQKKPVHSARPLTAPPVDAKWSHSHYDSAFLAERGCLDKRELMQQSVPSKRTA